VTDISVVDRHPQPGSLAAINLVSEASVGDYLALMKPRVMSLVVFTALVGLVLAPAHVHPLIAFTALLCIAVGAGAAGALNMWFDADIDAVMTRTVRRPIPSGRVTPGEALAFGMTLATGSVVVLGLLVDWLAALMIGWAAATGSIGVEPFLLFLLVFFWTPPHFWALSLNRTEDYARARIPMLPVVAGAAETRRQILIYSLLLLPVGAAPWLLGYADAIYGITALVGGGLMAALSWRLWSEGACARAAQTAGRLFAFSILYLFVLFAVLLVEGLLAGLFGHGTA
jgi:heme o synthase